jgi:Carboxypeptidase regulatory-like domain
MPFMRLIPISLAVLLLATLSFAQDRSTGTIKGKVKVEVGTPVGVTVIVRQGEREVGQTATGKDGEFVTRLPPGIYGLTFRKPGLSVGTIENVEVKAGKTRSLGDRLVLTIDEGSIAFIRGSVFNHQGLSVRGARVELARIQEDGSARKIDGRVTSETGSFVFRLMPDVAKYRLTAKLDGVDAVSKDIEIDGPAVYRLALSFPASPK